MQPRYRQDYPGEFVIVESKWSRGKKEQKREWVPNPINNQHISGRAACIGSKIDQELFDYKLLEKHRGGLLGSKKLQTYGTAQVADSVLLDFTVDLHYKNIKPLSDSEYALKSVVYTSARNCIQYPGQFYLIPQNPHFSTLVLPIYLAAFDGHDEIFLLGYNKSTEGDRIDWIEQIASIIEAYSSVVFTMVGSKNHMPEQWMQFANTQNFTYRDFINYCDI